MGGVGGGMYRDGGARLLGVLDVLFAVKVAGATAADAAEYVCGHGEVRCLGGDLTGKMAEGLRGGMCGEEKCIAMMVSGPGSSH